MATPEALEGRELRTGIRRAAEFALAPLGWFLSQQLSYLFVRPSCGSGSTLPVHVATLLGFAIAAAGAWLAWQTLAAAKTLSRSEPSIAVQRDRFLATLSLLFASLIALLLVFQALANFIVPPCAR